MLTAAKKSNTTFKVGGEEFVVLRKDHLDELLVLFNSFAAGERLLKMGKARPFSAFLRTVRRRSR